MINNMMPEMIKTIKMKNMIKKMMNAMKTKMIKKMKKLTWPSLWLQVFS